MPHKHYFRLQRSESIITLAAAEIFSAFVASGQVSDDNANEKVGRAVSLAVALARQVEESVQSDSEATGAPPPRPPQG
ncbi:MAG TPA: hypothetical protein VML54_15415 [Candidatus Limnocylindrales bacterium]|nr:hypothetical protein [Candidatus Limnocylindrales bacterium]